MAPELVLGLPLAAVLLFAWGLATRDEARRHRGKAAEWEGPAVPALWTSSARCPECRCAGGVLEPEDAALRFTCLACGAQHRRETKG